MNRAKQKPDWEYVTIDQLNTWQRVAAASHSILTPANFITLIALSLVLAGVVLVVVDEVYLLGFTAIAIGRLLDLADGAVAERTQTKGPLGEALDSIADKIAFLVVFVAFALKAIMPLWLLGGFVALQLANSTVVITKKLKGTQVHTTRWGKISTLLLWVTLGMFSVVFLLQRSLLYAVYEPVATILAAALYITTIVVGILTLKSYLTYKASKKH